MKNGPVVVAIGTTKGGNFSGEPTVVIRPRDLDTEDARGTLDSPTVFRIVEGETTISPGNMKDFAGTIPSDKMEDVRRIRRRSRRGDV